MQAGHFIMYSETMLMCERPAMVPYQGASAHANAAVKLPVAQLRDPKNGIELATVSWYWTLN